MNLDYKYSYNQNPAFLWVKTYGVLTTGDFAICYNEIMTSAIWKRNSDLLWDHRNCDTGRITLKDIAELNRILKKHYAARGNGKSALVIRKDFEFGLGRMYGMKYEHEMQFDTNVFKSLQEAIQWLAANSSS